MRPEQGPKRKFEEATEKEMVEYTDFGWEIGIPKSKDRFAHELVHYMEFFGIRNKFQKTIPGKNNISVKRNDSM